MSQREELELDRLEEDVLRALELPAATSELLRRGVPREIRIPGWLGPTLFSSEIRDGRPRTLGSFSQSLSDHELAGAAVVATVRETQGPAAIYAAFCLQPTTGALFLVDLGPPCMVRFVNAGLDQFLRSTAVFLARWEDAKATSEADLPEVSLSLKRQLEDIDATALRCDDNYWPTWLETEFAQLP